MGTPRPLKKLLRSDWARAQLCRLGAWYIRLVWVSGRWTVTGDEVPRRLWRAGQPFILCFWHGRLLMMPYCWRTEATIKVLVSHHRDGQITARTVGHFGIEAFAGSTSQGGSAALRAMLRALKAGSSMGITPDGPRGPRMRASPGVVNLARLAGVPILPSAFSSRRRRLLGSWDRFLLAWPFSRGVIVWGDPIEVAGDAGEDAREDARRQLEEELNRLTQEADRLCGHEPVEPDPRGWEGGE